MLNDKRRSLLNSALFRADNRTEQKTISPFSFALTLTFDFAVLSEHRSCPEDRSRRIVPVGTLRRHKLHIARFRVKHESSFISLLLLFPQKPSLLNENDLHLRTLEVAQIREDEYFGNLIADDLKGILRDIRSEHRPDTMTADEVSFAENMQNQLREAMNFEGSSEEKKAKALLATLGIDYDAITMEQFVNLIEVLKLSKHLKTPISQRGKTTMTHGKGKRKKH